MDSKESLLVNKSDIALWDDYSNKFNLLSDKLIKCGIDIKLLTDVLQAYNDYELRHKFTTWYLSISKIFLKRNKNKF